jgi:D-alanyl-D-alanine carboxypeptidase
MAAPGHDLCVSVLTNAIDGLANPWAEGAIRILQTYAKGGAPLVRTRDWSGRWWSLWETIDLVALRDHVLVASPGLLNPFLYVDEIDVTGRDQGRIRQAGGFASHGEGAHLVRGRDGRVREVWLGGTKYLPEARMAAEMKRRYDRDT